jgi:hypothetical protein
VLHSQEEEKNLRGRINNGKINNINTNKRKKYKRKVKEVEGR